MTEPEVQSTTSLERSLTLPLLIFYGVGTILGIGIYVLLGKVAGEAGMLAPVAFLVAAVLAAFTGLSYGELAARIPKSAGEVNYVDEAFGQRWLAAAVGWLIVVSAIVSTATVVNGYVGYVHVFATIPPWLVISVLTLGLGAIAVWGITESAWTIAVITSIEVAGIVLVAVVAGGSLAALPERWQELVPGLSSSEWAGVAAGAFLAFFTFIGFEDMVNVAEEAKHPERDMPRAIIVSLIVLTVLYVLVATIAALGLEPQELEQSEAPLADILAQHGEGYPKIISAISLVAVFNGVLVQIVMGARVLYGMARKRMAPRLFGRVHPKTRTPIWSTVLATLFVLALALLFEMESLARATSFILLMVFVLVNASLWVLQRRDPHPAGVRTVPRVVPLLGGLFSLALLVLEATRSM